jgi:hypothetical protein
VYHKKRLARIEAKIDLLLVKVNPMSKSVDDLVAVVAAEKTVIDSTSTLLDQLFAQVQAGVDAGDIAKVQQAVTDLQAQKAELVAAVVRNTPAAPVVAPPGP